MIPEQKYDDFLDDAVLVLGGAAALAAPRNIGARSLYFVCAPSRENLREAHPLGCSANSETT
jgi:hypothetical protein